MFPIDSCGPLPTPDLLCRVLQSSANSCRVVDFCRVLMLPVDFRCLLSTPVVLMTPAEFC